MSELSNVSVNGERQSWEQLYEREREENVSLRAYRTIVQDLDRCEHGRHEGDVCSSCGGPSKGNPCFAEPAQRGRRLVERFAARKGLGVFPIPERLVGFGLEGVPICIPERGADRGPENYYQRSRP